MTALPKVSFVRAISHGPLQDIQKNQREFTWTSTGLVDNIDNDTLSHLTEEERNEAERWLLWASEFALHPYKSHEHYSSSRICKPTLRTKLNK